MKEDGGEKAMLGAFGVSCLNQPLSCRQVELTGVADDTIESDDECRGYVVSYKWGRWGKPVG
jgi:hypothetical protein